MELKFRMYNGEWSSIVKREIFKKRRNAGAILFDPRADLIILAEQFVFGKNGDCKGNFNVFDGGQRGHNWKET